MIEIKNLTHRFGNSTVLEHIDLTFEEGKIYGLIGINGAGKSTLMRLMSSVYRANSGSIWIDGEPIDSNAKLKELVFFLPDDPYYSFNATPYSLSKMYEIFYPNFDMKLFKEYIKKFDIDLKGKMNHFSKGMRRRVFLTLAIACQVKYLFLDEAFDGLDPLARIEFNHFLLDAFESHTMTVIISSHSLKDLEEIIDGYVILDHQKVLASGKMMENFEQYVKYQMAYTSPITEELFKPLHPTELKIVGKIVQIVVRRDEEIIKELEATNPVMIEELEMDFNDYFTNIVSEGGNK
ncbi:MAG: ABC transporter ATP-binding protein [Anaeroplasmataceae bacterium]|nr:ABC transporter ATP-binding protein [Anaeroplasmataceae bacterium]MDE6414813.1 ABC transporter ATP-binding protein [Anaeroplasmataceae bacterium]